MPASEMDRFIPLAMKARDQKIATLSLVPPMINTADPDIDLIQEKVEEAIDRAEGKGDAPGKGGKRKADSVTGGSLGLALRGVRRQPGRRPRLGLLTPSAVPAARAARRTIASYVGSSAAAISPGRSVERGS